MTFKVLIIEDNHSFIDSLKVMLRDLQLDFIHAFRFGDAEAMLEKNGVFYNRSKNETSAEAVSAEVNAAAESVATKLGGKYREPKPDKLYNEGGVFLVIVEQNTESSMKGTDFIAHITRKYPGLAESDFILLTHRLELVPQKNYGYPILEKPLRQPQIRQIVSQKLKAAQDTVEMQIRLSVQKIDEPETPHTEPKKPKRKGFRDFIKSKLSSEEATETASDVPSARGRTATNSRRKKPAKKAGKHAAKPVKKAKGK